MKNDGSGCSKFLSSTVLAGVVGIIGLAWAVYTFYQDNRDTQRELDNQAIQISQQQTQIALANEQNQLQVQQLTLAAQQFNIEGHLLTPIPSDVSDFSLTAIAAMIQATQIEATSQAIATKQKGIEATQTAIAFSPFLLKGRINPDFPSPSINIRSYPGLPDNNSNIVGSVKPGDSIIVIGWTKASWTWYQIDVPSRNIRGAWISGRISINEKVYDSVILEGNISVLPSSLFIDSAGTSTP